MSQANHAIQTSPVSPTQTPHAPEVSSAPRKQPYEVFAERIIEGLQRGDCLWTKPWKAGELSMPVNAVTGKTYLGVNALHLLSEGLADPRFCTLKQANDAGWRVRKGEKSRPIMFWTNTVTKPERDDEGRLVYDENGIQKLNHVELERPICKVAHVFHVTQLEGDIPAYKPAVRTWDPNERAEAMLGNSGVNIVHDQGDRAFYQMRTDQIHLPPKDQFPDAGSYYSTTLHELGHATRHPARLNRPNGPFGSPEYAREELRAEIASFMLGVTLGLGSNPDQHQAYVNEWIKTLKEDPYEIVRACRDAEKIKEYVMGWEHEKAVAVGQETIQEVATDMAAMAVPQQSVEDKQRTSTPVFLSVPYAEKEQAKAVGAKWDNGHKYWFVPAGAELAPLSRWLSENRQSPAPVVSPEVEFAERLKAAGLELDGLPVMDGQLHRVPVEGHPQGKDGAYRGNLDGRPAGWLQNFVTGEVDVWKYSGHTLTPDELARVKAEAAQKQREEERARQEQYKRVAQRCNAIWERAGLCPPFHPYLTSKTVSGYGIKGDSNGNLLIPLRDVDGNIHSLQTISAEGQKRFESGGRKTGYFHLIDPEQQLEIGTRPILIAEGYATAATVHAVTKMPVVCAFDAGNLLAVAKTLRAKYPDATIAIVADNDLLTPGNPGLTKAKLAADAIVGSVYAPTFTPKEAAQKLTDWNDLSALHGPHMVAEQLMGDAQLYFAPDPEKRLGIPLYQARPPRIQKNEQNLTKSQAQER